MCSAFVLAGMPVAGNAEHPPVRAVPSAVPPALQEAEQRCAALAMTPLADGHVDEARYVAAGQADSAVAGTSMTAFCRVKGTATPTPRSRIRFEIWLPATNWDGRVHMVGNGGYSSEMRYGLMETLVQRGTAAVATDTGHQSADKMLGDLQFGFSNPEAIADWGHRAVHETIAAGKQLILSFYGRPARYAYFSGCSTGGHQALMEAQRYPADFDGILAGDPGNNRTNLNLAFLWLFLQNHEPGDNRHPILDRNALMIVNRAVIAQCDRLDGVLDHVVTDPRQCRFDPAVTLCKPGQSASTCLSARQVKAVAAIYGGPRRSSNGEILYPGWPAGSEFVTGQGASMGWDLYWANLAKPDEPQRVDYFRQWVFHDPAWDWWTFDWDKDVDRARAAMGPVIDAINPDLTAFRARGGKLVMLTGWQDPVVSPFDTIDYYDAVVAHNGSLPETQSFARLFMVPGMEHCAGGPGATNFASSLRDSPPMKADATHDISLALEHWVESGKAPDMVIAANYGEVKDTAAPASGYDHATITPHAGNDPAKRTIAFTRKLCPYPAVGSYRGHGDPNSADSYVCRPPAMTK